MRNRGSGESTCQGGRDGTDRDGLPAWGTLCRITPGKQARSLRERTAGLVSGTYLRGWNALWLPWACIPLCPEILWDPSKACLSGPQFPHFETKVIQKPVPEIHPRTSNIRPEWPHPGPHAEDRHSAFLRHTAHLPDRRDSGPCCPQPLPAARSLEAQRGQSTTCTKVLRGNMAATAHPPPSAPTL